jgi:hypothetical protein
VQPLVGVLLALASAVAITACIPPQRPHVPHVAPVATTSTTRPRATTTTTRPRISTTVPATTTTTSTTEPSTTTTTTTTVPGTTTTTIDPRDIAVTNDLLQGLADEEQVYAQQSMFDPSPANMAAIDPSLDWGGALDLTVGYAFSPGDNALVCLSELSGTGVYFIIAEVTLPDTRIYKGRNGPCPANPQPSFFFYGW